VKDFFLCVLLFSHLFISHFSVFHFMLNPSVFFSTHLPTDSALSHIETNVLWIFIPFSFLSQACLQRSVSSDYLPHSRSLSPTSIE
jgi:hypothetical protein